MPITNYVIPYNDNSSCNFLRNVFGTWFGISLRKRLLIAISIVVMLSIFIVLSLLLNKSHKPAFQNNAIFETVAPYVSIDESIKAEMDPCENFYEFSCGHWSQSRLVASKTEHRLTTFEILQQSVDAQKKNIFENSEETIYFPTIVNESIRFYHDCIKANGTNSRDFYFLMDYFDKVMRGWPILNPEQWNEDNFDWILSSAQLMKNLTIETIFGIYSALDDIDTSKKLLLIKPPILKNNFPNDPTELIYGFLESVNFSKINVENFLKDIQGVFKTADKWNSFFSNISSEEKPIRKSFKELRELYPDFDWLEYIQLVHNDTLHMIGKKLVDDDFILVQNVDHINNLITALQNGFFTKQEIADLFGWFVFQDVFLLIPDVLDFYALVLGYDEEEKATAIQKQCYDVVTKLYEGSLEYLYVRSISHFGIVDGQVLVDYVKNSFKQLIDNSNWLDNNTKKTAIFKLESMKSVIGFEKYFTNKKSFNKLYENFPSCTTSNLRTYFTISAYYSKSVIYEIELPQKFDYLLPRAIFTVSSYYDAQRNRFVLPISIYNPPFYHLRGPWYLNFGALGSIIGHEITHGFDSVGHQRDENGSLKQWWSNCSSQVYYNRSMCFVDQYNMKETVTSRNDDLGFDEDIADSEGLRLAYRAYQNWVQDNNELENKTPQKTTTYTPEQMFFISFASVYCSKIDPRYQQLLSEVDPHSIPESRVNGAVSNSEAFAELFHCAVGSPMNPQHKCAMW